MWDLAKRTIRVRKGGFAAAFIALFCGAALVTACGMLFESSLRGGVPPERYAAASVVVGARQSLAVKEDVDRYLGERVPLPSRLVEKVGQVPGVERAIGDVSVPITIVANGRLVPADRPIVAHGQDSFALGRYSLQAGTTARGSNEVMLDLATAAAADRRRARGTGSDGGAGRRAARPGRRVSGKARAGRDQAGRGEGGSGAFSASRGAQDTEPSAPERAPFVGRYPARLLGPAADEGPSVNEPVRGVTGVGS